MARLMKVFHQDSPGMRVWVKRNWWQRLIRPADFSVVGEQHLYADGTPVKACTRQYEAAGPILVGDMVRLVDGNRVASVEKSTSRHKIGQ